MRIAGDAGLASMLTNATMQSAATTDTAAAPRIITDWPFVVRGPCFYTST